MKPRQATTFPHFWPWGPKPEKPLAEGGPDFQFLLPSAGQVFLSLTQKANTPPPSLLTLWPKHRRNPNGYPLREDCFCSFSRQPRAWLLGGLRSPSQHLSLLLLFPSTRQPTQRQPSFPAPSPLPPFSFIRTRPHTEERGGEKKEKEERELILFWFSSPAFQYPCF